MSRRALASFGLCAWALAMLAGATAAQQAPRNPRIGYVYPAGGQRGTSVEVVVGGQMLAGSASAVVSGGVRATVVSYKRPLTVGQANRLRDRLLEARKKLFPNATGPLRPRDYRDLPQIAKEAGVTEEELRALDEFRRRRSDPRRQPNPQIEEEVTLSLEIAPDANPGARDLRLITPIGMSNPVRFIIGTLPEVREIEPNDRLPDTSLGDQLPAVINGRIMPGDVDRISFKARKGMSLVAAAQARDLIPYLADAVPGWFQAVLTLYDANGREVAYADDFQFQPDPVLHVVIPADGVYTLVIRDALYRGREDFVYRITVGEVPFITGMFPLGIRKGKRVAARVMGWNLPSSTVMLDGAGEGFGTTCVEARGARSNEVTYRVDDLPEITEKEPNNTVATAAPITIPVIVNGRIEKPGCRDVYRFYGRKGQRIIAEVMARRVGSPLDSLLIITDARGRRLALSDDHEDKAAGLVTHHADSYLALTVPGDGVYYLEISDAQGKGGPEYAYRLRVSPPLPDFDLRIVPSGVWARAGMTVPLTVYAIRRDGFDGAIDLDLDNPPGGFVLSGARIPAGAGRVTMTITCAPTEPMGPTALRMRGTAVIGDARVQHAAKAAEEMEQAFAYKHLVPAQEWLATVAGRAFARPPKPFSPDRPVRIPLGGKVELRAPQAPAVRNRPVYLRLEDPPAGITMEATSGASPVLTLTADAKQARAGTRGNLIIAAFVERPAAAQNRQAAAQRVLLGYLPALPFEVVKAMPTPNR